MTFLHFQGTPKVTHSLVGHKGRVNCVRWIRKPRNGRHFVKQNILKGLYHTRVFAICLQSDPESYECCLSVRAVYLKLNP